MIHALINEEDPPGLPRSSFSLNGDAGPDTIFLTSPQDQGGYLACPPNLCRFHVDGGLGEDVLSFQYVGDGVHLDGDEGPDRLFGRGTPDILHGGPGPDAVFGGPGHDICVAEVRRSC